MNVRRSITVLAMALAVAAGSVAAPPSRNGKKSGARKTKSRTEQTRGNRNGKKSESRAELQRRQQATQQEIAETRAKIRENDRLVSRNLAELGKLQGNIQATKTEVEKSARQVSALQSQISGLQSQIGAGEKKLEHLRSEYLKAVKAVRKRKGTNSDLAYLFSAKSLSDARRRMRYLKEFSDWRKKQTSDIQTQINALHSQKNKLAQSKTMYDKALSTNLAAQRSLESQYSKQDAIVVELKANGTALNNHLARKQAEVNTLKNQVAALIAAEQREAERREAERKEAERREALRREAERKAEEEKEQLRRQELARAEQARQSEQKEKTKKEESKKPEKKTKQTTAKQEKPKKDSRKDKEKDIKKDRRDNSYADARRRRPRGDAGNSSAPARSASSSSSSSGSGFASMRGSLPRPVSGAFRVTSRFGVHALPDLPDVKYDNPGIDAEVASGATALAVYAGKVSGVYMIPGFSTVVIVNHGSYYTVYGNLASASVKVGDMVKQGQGVGHVADSDDNPGHGQIHFEVWKNRDKQDPLAWIR